MHNAWILWGRIWFDRSWVEAKILQLSWFPVEAAADYGPHSEFHSPKPRLSVGHHLKLWFALLSFLDFLCLLADENHIFSDLAGTQWALYPFPCWSWIAWYVLPWWRETINGKLFGVSFSQGTMWTKRTPFLWTYLNWLISWMIHFQYHHQD